MTLAMMAAGILAICGAGVSTAQKTEAAHGGGKGDGHGSGGAGHGAMAWQAQSDTVARIHSLSQKETTQLAVAYKAARESHAEALVALRGEGESEGAADMMAMAQLRRSERGKLR